MKIILLLMAVMLLMTGADARYSPGLEIAEGENITLDSGFIHEFQTPGIWNIMAYGAIPNDGTDDAEAIQNTINAASIAGGGVVIFPTGRYDLNTSQTTYNYTFLTPRSNVSLIGLGKPILRVMDGYRTPYRGTVILGNFSEEMRSDITIEGITFDGNGQNNLIDSPTYTAGEPVVKGSGVELAHCGNVTVRDCEFRNISGFNVIMLEGYGDSNTAHGESGGVNCLIENNYIWNVGNDISGNDMLDFSAIYLSCANSVVRNNFILASTGALDENMCGIEIHSPHNVAVGNIIKNLGAGVYVNCDAAYSCQIDSTEVRDNTITAGDNGIVVWGNKIGGRYKSILIEGNHIMMYPTADNTTSYGITHGSYWDTSRQFQTNTLSIINNDIEFYDQDVLRAWSYGIYTRYVNKTVIKGNTVRNTTYEGISCRHYDSDNPETIDISGNTIIQFGTTTHDSASHFGILDWVSYTNKQSTITGNTIICYPTKNPNYNCGIGIQGAATKNVSVIGNNIRGVWVETFASNSPTSDSKLLIVGYSNAIPTVGAYSKGSIMWNTVPSAGGPPGWVCTTSGLPGTWKAMASLAS